VFIDQITFFTYMMVEKDILQSLLTLPLITG